jgi:hypothetical protein
MRFARVLVIICGSLAWAASVSAQTTVHLRQAPLEAYGVICNEVTGEVELTTGNVNTREVTYTGVVLSPDDRVAGKLIYSLTLSRDLDNGAVSYSAHIEVRPTAFAGKGEWHGAFGGELTAASDWENASALGRDLLFRRTMLVRRGLSGPPRSAKPPETRVVRRLLRGTGELEGMRLVFDHRLSEGELPGAEALPANCLADFELWKGVIVNVRQ